jgi:hypothetical protein
MAIGFGDIGETINANVNERDKTLTKAGKMLVLGIG